MFDHAGFVAKIEGSQVLTTVAPIPCTCHMNR